MARDEIDRDAKRAATEFERELETLLLGSFARGVTVEGTVEIVTPIPDTPNWSISIEKHPTREDASYDPQFLEE